MKAKLVVEGKEFDIEILDPKLQELIAPKKKTGYERVEHGMTFFYHGACGGLTHGYDLHNELCDAQFDSANYFSDKTVAANTSRADELMRQLRRFAVEHRESNINWVSKTQPKFVINCSSGHLGVVDSTNIHTYGTIYFDRIIDAEAAIEAFKDELIWYFTEYKDSL